MEFLGVFHDISPKLHLLDLFPQDNHSSNSPLTKHILLLRVRAELGTFQILDLIRFGWVIASRSPLDHYKAQISLYSDLAAIDQDPWRIYHNLIMPPAAQFTLVEI